MFETDGIFPAVELVWREDCSLVLNWFITKRKHRLKTLEIYNGGSFRSIKQLVCVVFVPFIWIVFTPTTPYFSRRCFLIRWSVPQMKPFSMKLWDREHWLPLSFLKLSEEQWSGETPYDEPQVPMVHLSQPFPRNWFHQNQCKTIY